MHLQASLLGWRHRPAAGCWRAAGDLEGGQIREGEGEGAGSVTVIKPAGDAGGGTRSSRDGASHLKL